jgi:hypothetical protein
LNWFDLSKISQKVETVRSLHGQTLILIIALQIVCNNHINPLVKMLIHIVTHNRSISSPLYSLELTSQLTVRNDCEPIGWEWRTRGLVSNADACLTFPLHVKLP